jgi:putative DNA primase/helicase
VSNPEVEAAEAILYRLRRGDLKRPFGSRDVWRPGWAKLSDRDVVVSALLLLVDFDWLAVQKQETRGRTATVYEVNPRALS